jgi:hypothetical protein
MASGREHDPQAARQHFAANPAGSVNQRAREFERVGLGRREQPSSWALSLLWALGPWSPRRYPLFDAATARLGWSLG